MIVFTNSDLDLFVKLVGLGFLFFYVIIKLPLKLFSNMSVFFFNIGGVDLQTYGKWAVVTGCTDGIGKAYAEQLAKRGFNIVLISRTLDKLKQQALELENNYNVLTKVIAADFTEPDVIYPEIGAQLEDLDIGILVNNVGVGYK